MIKKARRLRSSEVERVLKAGFSLISGPVRVKALKRESARGTTSRFAVVVAKKVAGSAVARNRLRRLAFSILQVTPPPQSAHDVVLMIGKQYALRMELQKEIETALARLT